MNELTPLPRSPQLLQRDASALLVVDVQEKLLPAIARRERMLWNIRRLIDGASTLAVPTACTEQNPEKLGSTDSELALRLGDRLPKLAFSCGERGELFHEFQESGLHQLLVVGIEAHVCVLQTVFDCLAAGFSVFVAVDAVSSRRAIDYDTALRRMDSAGVSLLSTESALFEWCERAGTPEFKAISLLVKEEAPAEV